MNVKNYELKLLSFLYYTYVYIELHILEIHLQLYIHTYCIITQLNYTHLIYTLVTGNYLIVYYAP